MHATAIDLIVALYQFAILVFSLSLHGCAQGWMASRLGDQTAMLHGHISLNPAKHIDPIGTLLYPLLMIFGPLIGFTWFGNGDIIMGWGRPTPVIPRNFKKITRDDNLTTLAGPAANLALALVGLLILIVLAKLVPGGRDAVIGALNGEIYLDVSSVPQAISMLAWLVIKMNLGLIFFNVLPVPPLDGSRILRNLLPYNSLQSYDQIATFGSILIFFLGGILVRLLLGPALWLVVAALRPFLQ